MFVSVTPEQQICLKNVRDLAADLGLKDAQTTDIVECSQFLLEAISTPSKYSDARFALEFFADIEYDWIDLPEIEFEEEKRFDAQFVLPLVLGVTKSDEDEDIEYFPIYGAIFKNSRGELYTFHAEMCIKAYHIEYYINNRFAGYIKWGGEENYTVDEEFYRLMLNMFMTCIIKGVEKIIYLSEKERDDYFVPFYN